MRRDPDTVARSQRAWFPRPRLPGDVGIRCADATRLPRWLKSRPKHHPLPHPETPMALPDSVLDTIGDTPIIKLQPLPPKHVSLYAKVESFNSGGSVKIGNASGRERG